MKRKRKKTGATTGLNLTPVLSIVFIMLLFFVVAAPVLKERGVYVVGWGAVCDCWNDAPVIIRVDSHNRIFVEEGGRQKQVDMQAVRAIVSRGLAESPRSGVLIEAHRHSDMGTVTRVMDQAKLARDPPPAVQIATMES